MTNIEELFEKHFPYEKPNPGQKEAILRTVEAFQTGKKHMVLSAPTGLGKSAIAVTVHRILRDLNNLAFRTTITTATKNLQDQYTNEFEEMIDLRGKTNYHCPKNIGPYNSAKCRQAVASHECSPSGMCPYYKQRKKWTDQAVLRITNTSFQIEACSMLVMAPETRADMIVIDECHNIDEHLVSHSTVKLDVESLQSLKKVVGINALAGVIDFINEFINVSVGSVIEANDDYSLRANSIADHFEGLMESLSIKLKTASGGKDAIAGAIEEMQQIADKLRQFSKTHGEWILTEYKYAHMIEYVLCMRTRSLSSVYSENPTDSSTCLRLFAGTRHISNLSELNVKIVNSSILLILFRSLIVLFVLFLRSRYLVTLIEYV